MSSREYLRPASGSHPRTRDAAAHGHYLCSHARHRASTAIDPRDLGADRPGRRLRAGAASVRSTMHEADDPLVVLAAARARFLAHERESARPALRAGRTELDERWPVSYALRFIVMVSIRSLGRDHGRGELAARLAAARGRVLLAVAAAVPGTVHPIRVLLVGLDEG
jgi:hypothetical protein